jgi:hypothetical protein
LIISPGPGNLFCVHVLSKEKVPTDRTMAANSVLTCNQTIKGDPIPLFGPLQDGMVVCESQLVRRREANPCFSLGCQPMSVLFVCRWS